MTVRQVLDYDQIIKEIIDNMKEVDTIIRFRFLQMAHQFKPIVENFQTIRDEKIGQYGSAHENGQFGIIEPDKDSYDNEDEYKSAYKEYEATVEKFRNELDEILESDAKIEIETFKPEEIINSGLPTNYMLMLYDLIEQ